MGRRGALLEQPYEVAPGDWLEELTAKGVRAGDLRNARPDLVGDAEIYGVGRALNGDHAELLAIVEAAERYACTVYAPGQFITAAATDLGESAVSLARCPKISVREAERPECDLVRPDVNAARRWVRGIAMDTGRLLWLPAVMVYLNLPTTREERIAHQISTGCAAHTDVYAALLNAACEVIERDAIAMTWLQRLALPLLDVTCLDERTLHLLERKRRRGIDTVLFDATLDLAVPTVMCLELADSAPHGAQVLACATDLTPGRAAQKAIAEATFIRDMLARVDKLDADPPQVQDLMDGALYMGLPEQRHAFEFLTGNAERREFRLPEALEVRSAEEGLQKVCRSMVAAGMLPIAVDLTTDELLRAGLCAVKVVVPELMPISFNSAAQFRGHRRLYDLPPRLGYPAARDEDDLNPWPLPFA